MTLDQVRELNGYRFAAERSRALWQLAVRRGVNRDAFADALAADQKRYFEACDRFAADRTGEHYECCAAAVRAWSEIREVLRANGADAALLEWVDAQRHQSGNTGD